MNIQTTSKDVKIGSVTDYTSEQVAIIKNTVAKGVTDTELAYFLSCCKTIGLNPFVKEIWCYKDHKNNLITFAGRDGFLSIAQRDKRWNGLFSCEVRQEDKFEIGIDNGKPFITHIKSNSNSPIIGAYCYILPKNCDIPTIEYVQFSVYNKNQYIWKSHPADMIKKVAELHALKKAFGISGLQSEYDFEVNNNTVYPIDTNNKPSLMFIQTIESLINTSCFDEQTRMNIRDELLTDITNARAEVIYKELKENQQDPIESGNNYNQSDINNKLDDVMADERK